MKIMGKAVLTKEQMKNYLLSKNPKPKINTTVDNLIDLYLSEGLKEGVRGDIAFAQSLVETGYFNFNGDVVPEQNNFSGIGTTGGGVKGNYFSTPQIGILAQIQHLKGYATKEPLNEVCVDPRYDILKAINKLGVAPTVSLLSGSWAVDKNYAPKILNIYNEISKYSGGTNTLKICLDAGHGQGTSHNRGYLSNTKWKNEGDGNYYFTQLLKAELLNYNNVVIIEPRPTIGGNPTLQARANKGIGCDLFISNHTNAFSNASAYGSEIFINKESSITLANKILTSICSTLNTKNRGVKWGNYAVLGYNNNAPVRMLIEYAFHTNRADVTSYENNAISLAKNMAITIANHYKLTLKSGLAGDKPVPPKEEGEQMKKLGKNPIVLISTLPNLEDDGDYQKAIRQLKKRFYPAYNPVTVTSGIMDYAGLDKSIEHFGMGGVKSSHSSSITNLIGGKDGKEVLANTERLLVKSIGELRKETNVK